MPMVYLMWSLRYGRVAGSNPWGATRPRMDDDIAAADRQFRGHTDRHRGRVHLPAGGGPCCLSSRITHPALAHQFDDLAQQKEAVDARHVGVPGHGSAVLRRSLPDLLCLPQLVSGRVHRGEPRARRLGGNNEHRGAHHQQLDDGAGGSRGADGPTPSADDLSRGSRWLSDASFWASRRSSTTPSSSRTTCPGPGFSSKRNTTGTRRFSSRSIS